ncbi:hypothetical protein HMPREF9946_03615 [Acetobacteraceae bacterium AT-5844]|nr:hypothetical protein HMPREF9946_03615 [Acetobacteraceae bacterium AT-5844]
MKGRAGRSASEKRISAALPIRKIGGRPRKGSPSKKQPGCAGNASGRAVSGAAGDAATEYAVE